MVCIQVTIIGTLNKKTVYRIEKRTKFEGIR